MSCLCSPYDTSSLPGPSRSEPMKVIQLVEVDAPPPRASSSSASPPLSSAFSSSYYDSEDSDSDTSEESESESECTSYCSSNEEDMHEKNIAFYDDTYGTRLDRVLAWRENFAKAMGVIADDDELLSHAPHPMKRKIDYEDVFFDSTSSSSKRSRSTSPDSSSSSLTPPQPPSPWAQRRFSAHSCPACDEGFTTRQSLQMHGQDPTLNDACRVAVLYGFEA